jgi:hypothetical protein
MPPPAPEVQVVEPEEHAKRMAEARKLYVEAFGEMRKNPSDAKVKFEKVMELAGPREAIWTAAMKYQAQLESNPK